MIFCPSLSGFVRLACLGWAWSALVPASTAAPAAGELGRPGLRHYTPGEHLRGIPSLRVVQDASGTMIFANDVGLLTFDGVRWRHLDLPPESAGVRQFTVAGDGTIFLAGAGVIGFLRGSGVTTEFVSLASQLPQDAANIDELRCAVAIGQTVYFSDHEKILVWRDGRFTAVPFPSTEEGRYVRLHRVGEALYLTSLDHGLMRLTGGQLVPERVADAPVLRENQIISVEAGAEGALVVLTAERGFFQVGVDGRVTPFEIEANRWLAGRRVFCAIRLPDGSRAVGFSSVSGDGGMRFDADGRYLGPIDTTIGLLTKAVRDFFYDREGGLWLGMDTGSARLEWPSAVSLFDVGNGLGQGVVRDVVRHAGVLYVGTTEGLFRLAPAEESGRTARFERLLKPPVSALASHPTGLIALGASGVIAVTSTGATQTLPVEGGASCLLVSKRDPACVWVGTSRGILIVRHGAGGWAEAGRIEGFAEACRALAEGPDGALWVAAESGGVFRLTFSREGAAPRVEAFQGDAESARAPGAATVTEWANEVVFARANIAGIFRRERPSGLFVPVAGTPEITAEKENEAWVLGAGAEALWVGGAEGIHRVSRDGRTQTLPNFVRATVGAVQRLREEAGPAGPVLWVGGATGLARIEVARVFADTVPFVTQLTATNVREGERLPPEHPELVFDFSAARLRATSVVVYQTRLAGVEKAWSEWSQKRSRSFTRLPSGRYRFEVRARDSDGVITLPASLMFGVQSPWWGSWWAISGYGVAALVLIGGVVRFRTRALRWRAEQLEVVVAKRTEELAHRTEELAQRNAELVRLNQLELDEKISARLAEEKARLEVLRYQLNPHFLFNTLASISAALPVDDSPARTMVERLADFCRLTLHRADERDWTTLGEEIELLRAYLEIEQSRWGDLLDVEIVCDPALNAERLPHFLLLPLLENALKYGRATSPDRVGIRLATSRDADGALVLAVANTGEWIAAAEKKTVSSLGIGLENLRERLVRYYPRAHRLDIASADGWVAVTLRLTPAEKLI